MSTISLLHTGTLKGISRAKTKVKQKKHLQTVTTI